jgi:hypothetical protein
LLASVDVMEFQTTDAYSSLDRTSAKYSMSIDSIVEKLIIIIIIIIIMIIMIIIITPWPQSASELLSG